MTLDSRRPSCLCGKSIIIGSAAKERRSEREKANNYMHVDVEKTFLVRK